VAVTSTGPLDVLLFSQDLDYADAASRAGMNGIVVDWEWRGKGRRQRGWDTEIVRGTQADLAAMRARVPGPLLCRINNLPGAREREARRAAELGADEIWLPMVRCAGEVERCLEALAGRCALGVLVETSAALALGEALSKLPLSRIYVGLNDLQIDSGRRHLFSALCDGALEPLRSGYAGPLGFAGVTRVERGSPVPCRLLLAEMARQSCRFAVARRSFRADVPAPEIGAVLAELRESYGRLLQRGAEQIASDRAALCQQVRQLTAAPLARAQVHA
jgi:hypothetical protein